MQVQACRAYYRNGLFVPREPLEIPEGSEAIVALLDFPTVEARFPGAMGDKCRRQLEALERFREGVRNCNEPVPEFERMTLREIEI